MISISWLSLGVPGGAGTRLLAPGEAAMYTRLLGMRFTMFAHISHY